MSFKEIKEMEEFKCKEMIKMKCNELAYKYLMNRRGSKGKEIEYKSIQMPQYLQPNNVNRRKSLKLEIT